MIGRRAHSSYGNETNKDLVYAGVIVVSVFLLLVAAPQWFGVMPNVLLAGVVVAGLLIVQPIVFILCAEIIILLGMYLPFVQFEHAALIGIGIAFFVLGKMLVLQRHHVAFLLVCIFIGTTAWWMIFGGFSMIMTLPFALELLYNAILASTMLLICLWVAKKSF